MIDIGKEELILLRDVPDHLPKNAGKKKHVASVYRWSRQGLAGKRLETVFVGGRQYTSLAALTAFFLAVTNAKKSGMASSAKHRGNAHLRALSELADI